MPSPGRSKREPAAHDRRRAYRRPQAYGPCDDASGRDRDGDDQPAGARPARRLRRGAGRHRDPRRPHRARRPPRLGHAARRGVPRRVRPHGDVARVRQPGAHRGGAGAAAGRGRRAAGQHPHPRGAVDDGRHRAARLVRARGLQGDVRRRLRARRDRGACRTREDGASEVRTLVAARRPVDQPARLPVRPVVLGARHRRRRRRVTRASARWPTSPSIRSRSVPSASPCPPTGCTRSARRCSSAPAARPSS